MTDILIIRSDVDQGKVKATYVIGFLLNDIPEDPDLIIEQYRGKSKWKCARKLEPSCPLIFWSLQQLRISKTSTLDIVVALTKRCNAIDIPRCNLPKTVHSVFSCT